MKSLKGLLIYPPNQLMGVETPRPDGSLGLLYLGSSLEKKGIETDILDASVGFSSQNLEETFYRNIKQENGLTRIGMSFKEIADYVTKGEYDFVGINSNFTSQTTMALETAKAIKKADKKIKVYAGGVNARVLKERFLATGYFNGVCLTEGELVFPRMVYADFSGKTLHNVPGVAFNYKGGIVKIPVDESCFPENLDSLPMPAWEKLPFNKYEEISSPHGVDVTGKENYKYAPIMTSRGCKFKCLYCHISEEKKDSVFGFIGKLRIHSIERVVEEVDKLKSLGVEKLFFEDDSLLAKKERVKEIFKVVKSKKMLISNVNGVNLIDFYTKSKDKKWKMDIEYLEILNYAGFEQIVFPAESGSQRILDKYASGKVRLDKMNLPLLMKNLTDLGIKAPVNMMIGFPDETEKEMQESIGLAKELMNAGAPYVTFFMPIPFPGSRLYDVAIKEGHLNKDFDTDLMNWKRPIMKNTIVPPERIEEIRDKANEEINTKEHLEKRLKQSMGFRWKSNI